MTYNVDWLSKPVTYRLVSWKGSTVPPRLPSVVGSFTAAHNRSPDGMMVMVSVSAATMVEIGYICLTPSCLRRGTGGDGDPRTWGKRETIATL